MVIGLPAYDQVKCAEYCIDKLKKNGFVVIYTYPNLIYISWEHVPSAIKNPEVKNMELEIKTNPYKDFSYLIQNMNQKQSNLTYFNKNLLEYNNLDDKLITIVCSKVFNNTSTILTIHQKTLVYNIEFRIFSLNQLYFPLLILIHPAIMKVNKSIKLSDELDLLCLSSSITLLDSYFLDVIH